MSKAKQVEFERGEISEIIAQNFTPCGEQYDASDFEWSAHCLQMAGFHKKREGGKYIRLEELQEFPIRKDHYDKGHGSEHFVFGVESVLEYAEYLPTYDVAPKIEWVSVEDRLPEENGSYLVIGKSGTPHTAHFYKGRTIHGKTFSAHFSNRYVTHWMPLPEAPKGGAE